MQILLLTARSLQDFNILIWEDLLNCILQKYIWYHKSGEDREEKETGTTLWDSGIPIHRKSLSICSTNWGPQ
jgi:hypothetical protein